MISITRVRKIAKDYWQCETLPEHSEFKEICRLAEERLMDLAKKVPEKEDDKEMICQIGCPFYRQFRGKPSGECRRQGDKIVQLHDKCTCK
jgi:hypothetical protein